jgi:hypothetical protein
MPRTDESWNTTAGVGATTGYCRGGLEPIVPAGCWIGMWAKPGPSASWRQLPTPVTIRGIGFYPDFSDESVILTGVCGPSKGCGYRDVHPVSGRRSGRASEPAMNRR